MTITHHSTSVEAGATALAEHTAASPSAVEMPAMGDPTVRHNAVVLGAATTTDPVTRSALADHLEAAARVVRSGVAAGLDDPEYLIVSAAGEVSTMIDVAGLLSWSQRYDRAPLVTTFPDSAYILTEGQMRGQLWVLHNGMTVPEAGTLAAPDDEPATTPGDAVSSPAVAAAVAQSGETPEPETETPAEPAGLLGKAARALTGSPSPTRRHRAS